MPKSSFYVKNLLKAVFVCFINFAILIECYFPEDSSGEKYGFCLCFLVIRTTFSNSFASVLLSRAKKCSKAWQTCALGYSCNTDISVVPGTKSQLERKFLLCSQQNRRYSHSLSQFDLSDNGKNNQTMALSLLQPFSWMPLDYTYLKQHENATRGSPLQYSHDAIAWWVASIKVTKLTFSLM